MGWNVMKLMVSAVQGSLNSSLINIGHYIKQPRIKDSQALNFIQSTIESRIKCEKTYKISKITTEEVTDGINALNHDKTDGSGHLFSSHLLLSSELYRKHVSYLFTAMS